MTGTTIGAAKARASQLGMSLQAYHERCVTEKWCSGCKAWHSRSVFTIDRSRYDGLHASCNKSRYRYTPVPSDQRKTPGPRPIPARDDDRVQARKRVNHLVDIGKIPDPNDLPCTDCGHVYQGDRRHEYDHHLGYGAVHHLDVEATCSRCHHKRENERGRQHEHQLV